jgi:transcriptional regulator with XRE-family HTH domain
MLHMASANDIRTRMAARGMTVQQLAKHTGMSYQRLWNKLHGRTALSPDEAQTLLDALGEQAEPAAAARVVRSEERATYGSRARAPMDASGKRFAILVSRWNELVTKELVEGAQDEIRRHGGREAGVIQVPGTWEMPVAARALLQGRDKPDAMIALGCIMQGQTAHAGLLGGDVGPLHGACSPRMIRIRLSTAPGSKWATKAGKLPSPPSRWRTSSTASHRRVAAHGDHDFGAVFGR